MVGGYRNNDRCWHGIGGQFCQYFADIICQPSKTKPNIMGEYKWIKYNNGFIMMVLYYKKKKQLYTINFYNGCKF